MLYQGPKSEPIIVEKQKHDTWNIRGFICATSIVSFALSGAALGLAIHVLISLQYFETATSFQISGQIQPSPYAANLDSTGAPLAMTIPNDLSAYIDKDYKIFSRTAQPHIVTISAGSLMTTWDGVNTVATFGGAVGDGFVFRVIDKNHIVILFVNNVAFS
jgi:hypothetical protein